jgi:hypothetical protein
MRREIPALRAKGKSVYVEDHPERLMAQSIVNALQLNAF